MSLSQSAIHNPSPTTCGLHASTSDFFTIYWVPVFCSRICMVPYGSSSLSDSPFFLSLFFLYAVVRKRVASDSRGWSSIIDYQYSFSLTCFDCV